MSSTPTSDTVQTHGPVLFLAKIIPETCIINVMNKISGGGNDSQKCPYNH